MAYDMPLNPLELDIAISRVCLAATKAKRGVPTTERERQAASMLCSFFVQWRDCTKQSSNIPPSFIPDQHARQLLEHTLSSISLERKPPLIAQDVVAKVLQVLTCLAEASSVSARDADDLITQLHGIGEYAETEEMPELAV